MTAGIVTGKHRCLDEEDVVRIAAGLVPVEQAQVLIAEVEECSNCRALLLEAGVALQFDGGGEVPPVFSEGELVAQRYRVQRFIGRGGMGEVFEVFDVELHERAALKTIRMELSGDSKVVKRFKQELRLARKVVHPNVGRVFDLGTFTQADGQLLYYLTMEFIDGMPLSRWRNQTPLGVASSVHIARQLASGLAAIHEHGIVHRDFKPENVMVSEGERPRAVILDFGIARSGERLSGLATTGLGVRLGTPDYMAPEALRGLAVTPASDVFSFGLLAYEMLTGKHPCPNAGTLVSLSVLGELDIAPPQRLRAEIPDGLGELVMACLATDPKQRPASGTDLFQRFERIDDDGHSVSLSSRFWTAAKRRFKRD